MLDRLIPFVLTAFCAAAAQADTVNITTAAGTVELQAAPATVAVFDVAVVDTLDALGVPVAGTVASLYVDYLDGVQTAAADLGTFWEPDLEAVHALAPDLIIVGARTAKQMDALVRIAPTIDMTVGGDTLPETMERLRSLGTLFRKDAEAEGLAADLTARLDHARTAAAGKGSALIVMTNGPKISAFGPGGRFGWLHSDLGVPEAAPEIGASPHGEAISFEFIRKADPDWLIVIDRLAAVGQPGESAAVTLDNALVQGTKAWQSGRVIYLNSTDIYIAGGGIQSLNRTLDTLIAGFEAD